MKKIIRIILSILLVAVLGTGIAFYIYASIYYRADEVALEVYEEGLSDGSIIEIDNMTIIEPEEDNGLGIIFYPGAKVEAIAYLPLLQQLADEGFTMILIEMPLNFAFLNADGADDVYELIDEVNESSTDAEESLDFLGSVTDWYMMGHSLGGAMASSYASDNSDIIEGLILVGAYVYGDYPVEDSLTIYGTLNDNLESNIDYTENIVIIEGGNHAQFGNYGAQKGDPEATISDVEQQAITVEAIVAFCEGMTYN